MALAASFSCTAAGEDWLMFPPVHIASIGDLADVKPVLEEMGKRPHTKANAAALLAITSAVGPDAPPWPCQEYLAHGDMRARKGSGFSCRIARACRAIARRCAELTGCRRPSAFCLQRLGRARPIAPFRVRPSPQLTGAQDHCEPEDWKGRSSRPAVMQISGQLGNQNWRRGRTERFARRL
jgi:hypothetical protein